MFKGWTAFIDTSKLAGWVRALVAALIGVAIARWPVLGQWLSPEAQQAVALAAGTVVVGVWSHVAKQIDN